MKNEHEIKALFFSQYWGQCVVQVSNGLSNNKQCVTAGLLTEIEKFDNPYLLLRTVEQLTDEEMLNVKSILLADYLSNKKTVYYTHFEIKRFSNFIRMRNQHGHEITVWHDGKIDIDYNYNAFILNAHQYLLRIGVLLPFTYLDENNQPQTLQPDDIIAKGWAKIQPPCP